MNNDDFTGARNLVIRNNATGEFVTIPTSDLTSDGIDIPNSTNEKTRSSFEGDETSANGVNAETAMLNVFAMSIENLGKLFPEGLADDGKSWSMPSKACGASDVDVAFLKVCDTKGQYIARHAQISPAFGMAITRDDVTAIEVSFYRRKSLGSEYNLPETDASATETFYDRWFDGSFDPSVEGALAITYDVDAPEA